MKLYYNIIKNFLKIFSKYQKKINTLSLINIKINNKIVEFIYHSLI